MAAPQLIAKEIEPQPGYQVKALSSPADIVIGGAAAGVGKTFSLLLEPLRHVENPKFGAVCFRRTSVQIRSQGGLWDASMNIYPYVGGAPRETNTDWKWPSGAKIAFRHLQYEKDVLEWQGTEIPLIMWDELTHFSESQFFYLLTRSRSTSGIKPYVRATCNPDPDSWVATLISWWIDQETGYPIPERDGVIRYFSKHGDDYIWGDTFEEVVEKGWFFLEDLIKEYDTPIDTFVKSITFISGKLKDNKALLSVNPAYLANLIAQDEQTVLQLLKGNWKVVISDKDIYDYPSFVSMFHNSYTVNEDGRYITADIAGMGSNKFVVGVWYGFKLVDLKVMSKNDGPQAVAAIREMARIHRVQNHNIVYDADGIGNLMNGFIVGAKAFHGGARPMMAKNDTGKRDTENYFNLKTQLYYRSGFRVKLGEMAIAEELFNRMYDGDKMTVRQRFLHERKAIKKDKTDSDGKLRIISKEEMKVILGGESPDLMDMFSMREIFELVPKPKKIISGG